jgi:Uma2 family endonuclease
MKRAASAPTFTWSDFVRLPEDDRRELVDGALVEVDVPKKWHERIVMLLGAYLVPWASKRRCVVLASGYKVRVSRTRGAMPDVQVLTEDAYDAAPEDGLDHGRPEIAIEIVSPRSRSHDRVRKLHWYASIGVPEYWIVDPRERSIDRLVLRKGEAAYDVRETAEGNTAWKPAGLRGLSIPLGDLWRAMDRSRRTRR